MSIKARRGLLLATVMVVIVGALLLSVGVSSPTEAQTATAPSPAPISDQKILVNATFLHADSHDATKSPTIVNLSASGYKPGDTLRISYEVPPGGFSPIGCQGGFVGAEGVRLLGVFSSSNVLLAQSARERVPGAIDAGEDIFVEATFHNKAPVDIPQDFRVTPPSGLLIEIPPSATHLFLGIADSYYSDNCGTGATVDIETAPDTTAPSLTVPSATIVVEATGPDGATVDFADDVSASDNVDPNPSINCTPESGTTFALETTTVSCTAKDASGNQSDAKTFGVKVQDTTAPVISDMPSDQTVEATGADGAQVSWTAPTANDAVDGNVNVNCSSDSDLRSGDIFPLETTTVTCSAIDRAGNSASGSFTVTVEDTTAPTLTVPNSPVVVEATGPDGATVNYRKPAAHDVVDGSVDVNCTPESGSQFKLGETTVTCTAQDAAGNQATPTTFKVKVQDTTAPSLTVPSDTIVVEASGPDGAVVEFADKVSASDAVDPNPSIDCTPALETTFALGTKEVSCTAKDASGNQSDPKTFDVKVQDTTAPVISGMPSAITEEATSSAGTVVNYTKPTANDAVDPIPVVTCSPAPGSTFPVGSTTVSCTAKDATGNESAPETFTVNVVKDNVAYEWSGFLQPINTPTNMAPSPYTQSIFKIGSTVPVKFKLTGASAGITDGNFYLKYIRTGNGDGQGETEVVATATGNTGTQFRYDAAAGQYIFNWSTKSISSSQAGNYEVRVYTDSAFTNLLGSQSIELR